MIKTFNNKTESIKFEENHNNRPETVMWTVDSHSMLHIASQMEGCMSLKIILPMYGMMGLCWSCKQQETMNDNFH